MFEMINSTIHYIGLWCGSQLPAASRRRRGFASFTVTAALVPCALGAAVEKAEAQEFLYCQVPAQWEASEVPWNGDRSPRNKLDDIIDSEPQPNQDIVVNFRKCPDSSIRSKVSNLISTPSRLFFSDYISSLRIKDATMEEIRTLVEWDEVAFIEKEAVFEPVTTVSRAAIKVASSSNYDPSTVEILNPAINGAGQTIAILDTGVDENHAAFAGVNLRGSYDALTGTSSNPPDIFGHGTHVASIALGRPFGNNPGGIANGADLVDVRAIPGTWSQVVDGLQTIYNNRAVWGVRVVNMSFGATIGGGGSDGLDSLSQLVDLGESLGLVMVAAAGNSGPNNNGLGTPAAATRAITVASSSDQNTIDRNDDIISSFSSVGPRLSDGDGDLRDELKPEITAPGSDISAASAGTSNSAISLSGTSMAAPHVAGAAALVIQANPSRNPATVKALLIDTAEQRGAPSAPGSDPTWNSSWGWGLLDVHASLSVLPATDMTYPTPFPNPSWNSPDIRTASTPIQVGVPNQIIVDVKNNGRGDAVNVHVNFGIHNFSASNGAFSSIGTVVVPLIPAGATRTVQVPWTPQSGNHQCAKISIGYPADTDPGNNNAQRNLEVLSVTAPSPGNNLAQRAMLAEIEPVRFQVANTIRREAVDIDLVPFFEFDSGTCLGGARNGQKCNSLPEPCDGPACPPEECPGGICRDDGWIVNLSDNQLTMRGDQCPAEIEVELQAPDNAQPGDVQRVHIRAVAKAADLELETELGGVSVERRIAGSASAPVLGGGWVPPMLASLLLGFGGFWIRRS